MLKKSGFALVELLVTVVVISVLAIAGVLWFGGQQQTLLSENSSIETQTSNTAKTLYEAYGQVSSTPKFRHLVSV